MRCHRPILLIIPALLLLLPPAFALAAPQKRSSLKGSSARTPRKKVKAAPRRKGRKKRARSRRRKDRWPPMKLIQANSGERLTVRLYDRKGRTHKAGARKLYRFMRCLRSGRKRVMNWRLLKHLYTVSRKYKGKTLVVYSAYRARKLPPGRESRHKVGRAVDFRVKGVNKRSLRDYLMKRFKKVGVGYYPNVPFVHFDVRKKRSAFWVDTSSSGKKSNYVDAWKYLKAERAGKLVKTTGKKAATAAKSVKSPAPATKSASTPALSAAAGKEATTRPAGSESPEELIVFGPPPLGPSAVAVPN